MVISPVTFQTQDGTSNWSYPQPLMIAGLIMTAGSQLQGYYLS